MTLTQRQINFANKHKLPIRTISKKYSNPNKVNGTRLQRRKYNQRDKRYQIKNTQLKGYTLKPYWRK